MRTILTSLLLVAAVAAGDSVLMFTNEGGLWVPVDGTLPTLAPEFKWIRGGADLRADGKAWFRARPQTGNGGVFQVSADGTAIRRVTEGTHPARDAAATRDGKTIVYAYRAGKHWQIWRAAAGKEQPLTAGERDCVLPAIAPGGERVAYVRVGKYTAKWRTGAVMLMDPATRKEVPLVEKSDALSLAFSPDGTRLAVGSSEDLTVFDCATAKAVKVIPWATVDKRLYAHGPHRLVWNPKGTAIACRIQFLGGRAAINGNYTPMFGDHELFFLPLDEKKPRWITLPKNVHRGPVRWK